MRLAIKALQIPAQERALFAFDCGASGPMVAFDVIYYGRTSDISANGCIHFIARRLPAIDAGVIAAGAGAA